MRLIDYLFFCFFCIELVINMCSAWKKIATPKVDLSEIMNEEYAKSLQEESKNCTSNEVEHRSPDTIRIPKDILAALVNEPDYNELNEVESDKRIAQILQAQFDFEYDSYLKHKEQVNNKNSKVQISLSKYRTMPEGILDDSEEEEQLPPEARKDWDRFETNEKEEKLINKKKGYFVDGEGAIKTKHDADISGTKIDILYF